VVQIPIYKFYYLLDLLPLLMIINRSTNFLQKKVVKFDVPGVGVAGLNIIVSHLSEWPLRIASSNIVRM
jgi:hypothetical protein